MKTKHLVAASCSFECLCFLSQAVASSSFHFLSLPLLYPMFCLLKDTRTKEAKTKRMIEMNVR